MDPYLFLMLGMLDTSEQAVASYTWLAIATSSLASQTLTQEGEGLVTLVQLFWHADSALCDFA